MLLTPGRPRGAPPLRIDYAPTDVRGLPRRRPRAPGHHRRAADRVCYHHDPRGHRYALVVARTRDEARRRATMAGLAGFFCGDAGEERRKASPRTRDGGARMNTMPPSGATRTKAMNPEPTLQMPGQWSTLAPQVDWIFYFIYWMSVVLFVGIIGAALYFVLEVPAQAGRRRRADGPQPPARGGLDGRAALLPGAALPLGLHGLRRHDGGPANAMEIRVREEVVVGLRVPQRRPPHQRAPRAGQPPREAGDLVGRRAPRDVHLAFRVNATRCPGYYGTLVVPGDAMRAGALLLRGSTAAAETGLARRRQGRDTWAGHFSMMGTVTIRRARRPSPRTSTGSTAAHRPHARAAARRSTARRSATRAHSRSTRAGHGV